MNDFEFSQWCVDTIGIMAGITFLLSALGIIIGCYVWLTKIESKKQYLKNEKLKLEIKKLEHEIEDREEKAKFRRAETELMEKKANKK